MEEMKEQTQHTVFFEAEGHAFLSFVRFPLRCPLIPLPLPLLQPTKRFYFPFHSLLVFLFEKKCLPLGRKKNCRLKRTQVWRSREGRKTESRDEVLQKKQYTVLRESSFWWKMRDTGLCSFSLSLSNNNNNKHYFCFYLRAFDDIIFVFSLFCSFSPSFSPSRYYKRYYCTNCNEHSCYVFSSSNVLT